MKYRTYQKLMAATLCGLLAVSSLTACGAPEETSSVAEEMASDEAALEAEQIVQAADTLLPRHSSEEGREETVYVIADANGNPSQTIVSTWLKNPDGADTLSDRRICG